MGTDTPTAPAETPAIPRSFTDAHGEVHTEYLRPHEAAARLADLAPLIEQRQQELDAMIREADELRSGLLERIGKDTPVPTGDGRRVVTIVEGTPEKRRRTIHPGACDTHREALVRAGLSEARTVTEYTNPKVSDLDDPEVRARLAVHGVIVDQLINVTVTPPKMVAVVTDLAEPRAA